MLPIFNCVTSQVVQEFAEEKLLVSIPCPDTADVLFYLYVIIS